jgi:hypothetical protein
MTFPRQTLLNRTKVAASTLLILGAVGGTLTTPSASANDFVLDFETDAQGNSLRNYDPTLPGTNPNQLDTHGSGDRVDIGSLWSDLGITIRGERERNNEFVSYDSPLGLFNSNCKPSDDGISLSGFTQACGTSTQNGDDDLATGEGYYGQDRNGSFRYDVNGNGSIQRNSERFNYYYNTVPQGNVLIFEENPGDGIPDDKGGSYARRMVFDFDREKIEEVVIGSIGIIDDATGKIRVNYTDNTWFEQEITNAGENDLRFFNPDQKDVKDFWVEFNGSGAVSGVTFAKFKEKPAPVPEPTGLLGLAIAGGFGVRTLRKRQSEEV